MDRLDYLILSELLKDAQASFAEIARKLGSSPYTVGRRYESMKKEGIFHRIMVSIDLSRIGYQGKAFLLIGISPQQSKSSVIEALKKISNIMVISELVGPFDLLAIAPVADLAGIRTLVEEVKKTPNIQRVEVALINDTNFPVNPSFNRILSERSRELATL